MNTKRTTATKKRVVKKASRGIPSPTRAADKKRAASIKKSQSKNLTPKTLSSRTSQKAKPKKSTKKNNSLKKQAHQSVKRKNGKLTTNNPGIVADAETEEETDDQEVEIALPDGIELDDLPEIDEELELYVDPAQIKDTDDEIIADQDSYEDNLQQIISGESEQVELEDDEEITVLKTETSAISSTPESLKWLCPGCFLKVSASQFGSPKSPVCPSAMSVCPGIKKFF